VSNKARATDIYLAILRMAFLQGSFDNFLPITTLSCTRMDDCFSVESLRFVSDTPLTT